MKKLTLLASLACLMSMSVLAQAQTEAPAAAPTKQAELHTWKTYSIKGDEITVSLPTHPAVTTNRRYRELLRQTLTDRMVGAYADGVVYHLYSYDNPEPRDSFEEFIARERGMREEISRGRIIKLHGVTGKEYSYGSTNLPVTTQYFAVGDRFYKFCVTGAPADDARVKHFFSSIVLNKKQGIDVSDGPGVLLPPPQGASPEVLTGKQIDTKVRLVMKPEPAYTESARDALIVGTVILKVVFASNGAVTNISTVQALSHGLTEQSIDAAKKIKFIPAIREGKYVSMWMQLEYNFNLY